MKKFLKQNIQLIAIISGIFAGFMVFYAFVIFVANNKYSQKEQLVTESIPENQNLSSINTIWNSNELGIRVAKKGEKCYGDKIVVDGQEFTNSIVVLKEERPIEVHYGACVSQNYNILNLKDQLQKIYPKTENNWETTVEL